MLSWDLAACLWPGVQALYEFYSSKICPWTGVSYLTNLELGGIFQLLVGV